MFSTIERIAAIVLGGLDDEHVDLFEAGGDGLLHAAVAGIDDEAVAAIGFGRNDGRLDDADGLDRRQQQRVGLRRGLGLARLVGIFLQRARIDLHELHGNSPVRGLRTSPLARSFLVFFPKTPPGPRSGRAGATAAEHPCPAGQAGLTALRRTTRPGSRAGAVERQRQRSDRSANRIFSSSPLPFSSSASLSLEST